MGTKDPREGKLNDFEHFLLSVISTLDDSAQSSLYRNFQNQSKIFLLTMSLFKASPEMASAGDFKSVANAGCSGSWIWRRWTVVVEVSNFAEIWGSVSVVTAT